MTGRRMRGGLGLATGTLAAGLLACESPTPPTNLPPLPPPPASPNLGDERVTAECGGVTIRAEPPRRVDIPYRHKYLVAVSIEAASGEAMVADFLRDYPIVEWRVGANGKRVRHDLTILWEPYWLWYRSSRPEMQPLVVRACPEGDGPVLACSELSCGVVASEDQVEPFLPSWVGLELTVPWGYSTIHELRVGETLSIPVTYRAHHDVMATLGIESWSSNVRRLEPTEQDLGTLEAGDSGTVIFRVMGDREHSPDDNLDVWISARTNGVTSLGPNEMRIRVVRTP